MKPDLKVYHFRFLAKLKPFAEIQVLTLINDYSNFGRFSCSFSSSLIELYGGCVKHWIIWFWVISKTIFTMNLNIHKRIWVTIQADILKQRSNSHLLKNSRKLKNQWRVIDGELIDAMIVLQYIDFQYSLYINNTYKS